MLNTNGILETIAERIVGKISMAINAHFDVSGCYSEIRSYQLGGYFQGQNKMLD